MTPCKVCACTDTRPLWPDASGAVWWRCLGCGSDNSPRTYVEVMAEYRRPDYITAATPPDQDRPAQFTNIVEWFSAYRHVAPSGDFLDIGCADGVMLTAMQNAGWAVHGFDVNPHFYLGPHTTIADRFSASLFPQQHGAAAAIEVIEHVEDWCDFLAQTFAALLPGGLFVCQTPRPWHHCDPIPYQKCHLQLFSPHALRYALERSGFRVLDARFWPMGQHYLSQRG